MSIGHYRACNDGIVIKNCRKQVLKKKPQKVQTTVIIITQSLECVIWWVYNGRVRTRKQTCFILSLLDGSSSSPSSSAIFPDGECISESLDVAGDGGAHSCFPKLSNVSTARLVL